MRRLLAILVVAALLPVELREPARAATAEDTVRTAPLAVSAQTGIASWYGPGTGVAMPFCTWTYRNTTPGGCGWVAIQSHDTGITTIAQVIDFCLCVVGNSVRIIDLQFGVVAALGLDQSRGLYMVTVWSVAGPAIPDTAMAPILDDEAERLYGHLPDDQTVPVCPDCYLEFKAWRDSSVVH